MAGVRAVRTKTGSKVHLSSKGSSRTNCGSRVAMPLTFISKHSKGCQGCGISPEMEPETIAQWLGLPCR